MKPLTALLVAGGVVLVARAYADAASSGRPTTTGAPRDSATPRVVPDAFLRAIGEFEAAIRGFPSSSADPALALDSSGRPFSGFLALADQGVQRPFLGGGSQNDPLATRVGAPNRGAVTPLLTVMPTTAGGFATFDPQSGTFLPGGDEPGDAAAPPDDPGPGPGIGIDVATPTVDQGFGLVSSVIGIVTSAIMGNPIGVVTNTLNLARQGASLVSFTGPQGPSHAMSPTVTAAFQAQRAAERGFVEETAAPPTASSEATEAAIAQTEADVAVAGIGNEGLGAPAGVDASTAAATAAAADAAVAGIGNEGIGLGDSGPAGDTGGSSAADAAAADAGAAAGVAGVGADAAGEGAGVGGGDGAGGVGVGDGDGGSAGDSDGGF